MLQPTITASAADKKQIVLNFSTSTGTVLYIVPEGKICKGHAFLTSTTGQVNVNGNTVNLGSVATTYPFEFVSGTALRTTSSNVWLVGVEE